MVYLDAFYVNQQNKKKKKNMWKIKFSRILEFRFTIGILDGWEAQEKFVSEFLISFLKSGSRFTQIKTNAC